MVVIAPFALEEVVPGRRGDILAAVDAILDVRHMGQDAGLDKELDVEAHAVVKIGIPAEWLPFERLPAHEYVVGRLAFEDPR